MLWIQAAEDPAGALLEVQLAVVQAERAARPQFDPVRHDPEAGPVRRARDRAPGEFRGSDGGAGQQRSPVRKLAGLQ